MAVKNTLDGCGMSDMFSQNEININWTKESVKRELIDQLTQDLHMKMNEQSIYISYKNYKTNLQLEYYLIVQPYQVRSS